MKTYGINADYIQYLANKTARDTGCGSATGIVYKNCKAPYVLSETRYGYRKNTTGEYVANAYRNKFGWKNTYYQNAECVVVLPLKYKAIADRQE